MAKTIELIVEGYVRLADRSALQSLKAHRQKLLHEIRTRPKVSGFDMSTKMMEQIEEELSFITAGLEKLQPT